MSLISSTALSLSFNKITILARFERSITVDTGQLHSWTVLCRSPMDNSNATDKSKIVNGHISKIITSTRAAFPSVLFIIIMYLSQIAIVLCAPYG
jgi:hypothetical protein